VAGGFLYVTAPGHAVHAYWLAAFTVTGTASLVLLLCWCWLSTHGVTRAVLSTLLVAAGLLASEHAVVGPLLALILGTVHRREPWRAVARDMAPAAALTAAYVAAKVWYLATASVPGAYALTPDMGVWVDHLGRYLVACCNAAVLFAPREPAARSVGVVLVLLLAASAGLAARRVEGWSWVASGLGFFVVALLPVLVLSTHYKDYYVAVAALGVVLAAFGIFRATTSRWRELAVGLAIAVVGLDLYTGGRAWRENDLFNLVVHASRLGARTIEDVRQAAARDGVTEVWVSRASITEWIFQIGQAHTVFPSMPQQVRLYEPGRRPFALPRRAVLPLPQGPPAEPYPGWDRRWDWLRRLAR
jgi:hypothetical protein